MTRTSSSAVNKPSWRKYLALDDALPRYSLRATHESNLGGKKYTASANTPTEIHTHVGNLHAHLTKNKLGTHHVAIQNNHTGEIHHTKAGSAVPPKMPALDDALPSKKAKRAAAGVLYLTADNRGLFIQRAGNPGDNYVGYWALPGGGIDEGETALAAAARECYEEIGHRPKSLKLHYTAANGFKTFVCDVDEPVHVKLNDEHVAHKWATLDDPPTPLHPGVAEMLREKFSPPAMDYLPFASDFNGGSVRKVDQDGHLHVAIANISKATINPYVGHEIPDWQKLGLNPDKIYQLLRHPDELKKGAASFVGKPLLIIHKPLDANDHPHQKVCGSIGTEVEFRNPYLQAPLTVWTAEAIELIESEAQKELSCGYRYDADMRPGRWNGKSYDGVMRNIRGNHVALVQEGRAGSDVVIGDSRENLEKIMFKTSVKAITAAYHQAMDGRLAEDATSEGLSVLLEALSNVKAPEAALTEGEGESDFQEIPGEEFNGGGDDPEGDAPPDDQGGMEEDPDAEEGPAGEGCSPEDIKMFLQQELSPEAFAQVEQMLASLSDGGGEEDPNQEEEFPGQEQEYDEPDEEDMGDGAHDEPPSFKGMPRVGGGKDHAMDKAAVQTVVAAAVEAAERKQRDLQEAREFALSIVGKIAGDSADAIYRKALTMRGIDTKGIKELPALKLLLGMQARPSATPTPEIAADSAKRATSYAERFPDAARIQHG